MGSVALVNDNSLAAVETKALAYTNGEGFVEIENASGKINDECFMESLDTNEKERSVITGTDDPLLSSVGWNLEAEENHLDLTGGWMDKFGDFNFE